MFIVRIIIEPTDTLCMGRMQISEC